MLAAVEPGPIVIASLLGGAIADRMDRRTLLLLDQIGLVAGAGGLALVAFLGSSPIIVLYLLAALLAAFSALQKRRGVGDPAEPGACGAAAQRACVELRPLHLAMVLGPGRGGLLIGTLGVKAAYTVDAVSCTAMVFALLAIGPQPPHAAEHHDSIVGSITQGLRYVAENNALLGSFAIDLVAMTFGMPRALFAALSVSVYHAGAAGTGVLYSAVSAEATVAALTTGWLCHVRRLGLVVIWAVVAWGGRSPPAGIVGALVPAAILFAVGGAADSVSAVCRSTINQSITPDHLRGRMSAVHSLVVTSGAPAR